MPLNPQAQVVLEMMAAAGFKLSGEPADVRAFMAAAPRPEGEPVASVTDRTIPANGADIPVRIYRPDDSSAVKPVLIWFHGGGWVIGSLDGADFGCRLMTNASGCVVISVDYRLAPEFKFPTPADDCVAVTEWVAAHGAELGLDASRIAVGGDSAGGNLAAVVCQLAQAKGGPQIRFQALVYPVTNYDYGTASYLENAEGYLLERASMEWFWGHYLRTEADGATTIASPLRHEGLAGQPPAFVITAEFDPLREEGDAYAEKLRAAGVPVEHVRFAGQIHGFYANPAIEDGVTAARLVGKAVAAALA